MPPPAPNTRAPNTQCPVLEALAVIGGKWKVVILYHLNNRVARFSELKRAIPGVTQKMLTQQLRELERDGLVARKVYPEVPPRVEYSQTALGKTLQPVLKTVCDWGSAYIAHRAQPASLSATKPAPSAEPPDP